MDRELQAYYDDLLGTFATPGWKRLIDQVQEIRSGVNQLGGKSEAKDFFIAQGELKQIDWLIGFPEQVKRAYDELENADL